MMTNATRKKAIRHIVSALLSGVFSEREVDQVSSALMTDAHFVAELGLALRMVSQQLSGRANIRGPVPLDKKEPRVTTGALRTAQLVKRLGISRRELLNIIAVVLPEAAVSFKNERLTTLQMISRAITGLNHEKRSRFFDELRSRASTSTSKVDPYLDLITKRLDQQDVSR
jgi:hypothetical protein